MTVPPRNTYPGSPARGIHRTTAIVLLGGLGVALSILAYQALCREHEQTLEAHFRAAAHHHAESIEHAVDDTLHELALIGQVFQASGVPDRGVFAYLVQPLLQRHPQMQAISWNPVVRRDERADFEAAAQAEGFEDFRIIQRGPTGAIVPAADRDAYVPVHLIEPLKANDVALGFDIASEPIRQAAVAAAARTGEAALSARVRLVQETGDQWGILALHPVVQATTEGSPPRVLGFVAGIFRCGDMVRSALGDHEPAGLDLILADADVDAEPGARFLHRHWSRTRSGLGDSGLGAGPEELPGDPELRALGTVDSFRIANRRWEVRAQPTPQAVAVRSTWVPLLALGSGLGFTVLVIAYLLSLTRFTRRLADEGAQRQAAYEALEDSHRTRDTLLSNLPGYAYRCRNDPDWTLQFISQGVEEATGYSVDEYMVERSITCGEKTHADDRDRVWQEVQEALDQRQPFETEYRIHHKSGAVRWMWERGRGAYGSDGQLKFIEGFVADITDAQEARQALKGSEQRHRSLVDSAPVCIHEIDLDGNFLSINSAGLRMCGLSDESEILGKPYLDVVDQTDRRHVSVLLEKARRGVPSRFEFHAAGTPRPVLFSSCFIPLPGPDGVPVRIMGMTEDITTSREAQEKLRQKEAQLRNLVDSSPDAIFVESLEGIVLDVNQAACDLHGLERDALIGQHVLDLVPPDHRDVVKRNFPKVATGDLTEFQGRSLHRDGTSIPTSVRANRIEHADQPAILLHVRDIRSEEAAARQIAESEERYRTMIEFAPEAVLVMDVDAQQLVEANRNAEQFFKMSREQLLAHKPWELSPPHQPDGRESIAAAEELIREAVEGGAPVFRWTHLDAEGNEIPCEIRLVRMNSGGRTLIRGSLIDIRDRLAAEAAITNLGRIVEESRNEIYVFDANTLKFLEVNRGARENLGYSMDELREMSAFDLKPLMDLTSFEGLLAPLRRNASEILRFETIHHRKDGSAYPVDVHLQASTFNGRDAFIGIALDTTERKQAEAIRLAKTEQLATVSNAMTSFLRSGDWHEASAGILTSALKQTQSEYGFVGVVSSEGKLRVLAHEGIKWDRHRGRDLYEGAVKAYQAQGYIEFDSLENLFGRVITQKQVVVANEPARDPRRGGNLPEGHPPLDTFLGVPLFSGDDVVGMIGVANRSDGYSDEEQQKLQILCQATGVLYDSYRRQQKERGLQAKREKTEQALQKAHDELEHRVAERTEQLRALALKVSQAEQNERRRVATGLHDNVGQLLAAAKIGLGALSVADHDTDTQTLAQEVRDLVDQCIDLTRSLTFELSPPALYELGLEPAVESLATQMSKQHGLTITVDDDDEAKPLDDDVRVFLFQAIRELLVNVAKHARTNRARVAFTRHNSDIRVDVEDDGIGIRPEFLARPQQLRSPTPGFGLFNIRERLTHLGGSMMLEYRAQGGTCVSLRAPLDLLSTTEDDDNAIDLPTPQFPRATKSPQDSNTP